MLAHYALTLAVSTVLVAAPHRPQLFPNANIVIVGIAGDSRDQLWLAAEDGLYRFDGIHYRIIPGLPFGKIRYVGVTMDDAVWVAGPEGLARYDGQFRVVAKGEVLDFDAAPERIIIRIGKEITRVGLDAIAKPLPFRAQGRPMSFDSTGALWQALQGQAVSRHPPEALLQPRVTAPHIPIPRGLRLTYTLPDALGRLWVADEDHAIHYDGDQQSGSVERLPAKLQWRGSPFVRGRGKELWFIGETAYELSHQTAYSASEDDRRFLPTAGYADADGCLWVARKGAGLVQWNADASWERWFSEDFGRQPVHSIFRAADGKLFAASHRGLYRLDGDRWVAIPSEPWCCTFVLPEADGTLRTTLRGIGPARLSAAGRLVERYTEKLTFDSFRKIVRTRDGSLWFSAREALFEMVGAPGSPRLSRVELPAASSRSEAGVFDIKTDSKGRLWVSYDSGLAWRNPDGDWTRVPTDKPIERPRSFAFDGAGDGTSIWLSYREPGRYSRLLRTGSVWQVTDYSPGTDEGAGEARFFERDSRGWIWRGTMDGVYVSNGHLAEPDRWLHLAQQNGLASDHLDEFGFFEDRDGSVWLAGQDGVTHVHPDVAWFAAPADARPPRIDSLEVDGVSFLRPDQAPGRARQTLHIELAPGFTPAFREQPLHYRLESAQDRNPAWQRSSGTIDLRDLPRGSYTLTVANVDDANLKLIYAFQFGSPLLWPWFGAAAAAGVASAWTMRRRPLFSKVQYMAARQLFRAKRRLTRPRAAVPDPSDYRGQLLHGHYSIFEVLSITESASTYCGHDTRSGQRVAVKVLRPHPVEQGKIRDKFALEIAALQSIHDPGIVAILEWWISPSGEGCLAMPFLEGPTLRTAMSAGWLSAQRIANIVKQVAKTLEKVHAQGIVHRDVKPENIMLTGPVNHEQAVLIDFGAAGFRSAEDKLALTISHAATFFYMAPERLAGQYGNASDLYSLAVVALEMLSGKRVYDLRVLHSSAAFPGELTAALLTTLDAARAQAAAAILCPCFDANPQGRPSDIPQWAESLRAAIVSASAQDAAEVERRRRPED